MSSSIKTVGFIGTGLMGLPMAKNILSKKFKLNVWNRTPDKTLELQKKGAKVFKDIKDLVQNSKVIVSMLANDDVCKAILIKKIQPYLKKGQIVIDMSSTTQNTALEIGKALKKKKASFLDAPVSGGTIGAEKGTLAIMVGGEKKIFNNAIVKHIEFSDNNQHFYFEESVSLLNLNDFDCFAKQSGFKLLSTFGNYHLDPFDEINSDRLILIFKKI